MGVVGGVKWGSAAVDLLIVECDPHTVQSDRLVILHHEGDLLTQGTAAPYGRFLPAQEVILLLRPDGTRPPLRWIRLIPAA